MFKKIFDWIKRLFINETFLEESFDDDMKMTKTNFKKLQKQYNHKGFEFVEGISGNIEIWRLFKVNENKISTTKLEKLGIYDLKTRILSYKKSILNYFENSYFIK